MDSDNDGVFDLVEAGGVDNDNNGLLDNFADHDGDGLGNSVDPDCDGVALFANNVLDAFGTITDVVNMIDGNAGTSGTIAGQNAYVDLILPEIAPPGTFITISISSDDAGATFGNVRQALDTFSFANTQAFSITGTATQTFQYLTTGSTKHLRITRLSTTSATRVHSVDYSNCNGTSGVPLVIVNTDGTGAPDFLDIDSDEDGCFDVREAGHIDTDGDGVLGTAPVSVNTSGVVTSSGDGYTGGNINLTTVGTSISLSLQPTATVRN